MPTPPDTRHTRFRRTMFVAAAVSLLCFLWTLWMLVHFNGGIASFRFGTGTMIKIASVALPGPVLLAFVGWQQKHRPCRVIGWLSFLPALLLCSALAVYSSIELRPLFAPGEYDASVKEVETNMLDLVHRESAVVQRLAEVHASLRQRPATQEACSALAATAAAVRHDMSEINKEYHAYAAMMNAPFDKRGVSPLRRDEYIRLFSSRPKPESYLQTQDSLFRTASSLEQRLQLLSSHWGAWHWQDSGAPLFDDDALNRSYDELIDLMKQPAGKDPS